MNSSGQEFMWEPIILLYNQTAPEDQLDNSHDIIRRYVKLPDRRIYATGTEIRYQAGLGPPTVESPRPVWDAIGMLPNDMLPGRGEMDVWVVASGNQKGCFYNAQSRLIDSQVYTIEFPARFLCYCPEYKVLLSVHQGVNSLTDPHVVRIWSLEIEPTVLTAPAPYIGTPKSGQVVTYRVRLTGAHNDPAEGELVDWGVIGVGRLLDIQSKTDKDGYAIARVQYLVDETGDSQIIASVKC